MRRLALAPTALELEHRACAGDSSERSIGGAASGTNGFLTAILGARMVVLVQIYANHKLVVTRLSSFMAVESPENRQK